MGQIAKASEAAAIGLHAALVLSLADGPHSARRLAALLRVSEAHLVKVMQRLVRAGFVQSIRGPKGGFHLAQDPARITLLQVFEAVDGPLQDTRCLFQEPECRFGTCILGDMLAQVSSVIRSYLEPTTLRDAIAQNPELTARLRDALRPPPTQTPET